MLSPSGGCCSPRSVWPSRVTHLSLLSSEKVSFPPPQVQPPIEMGPWELGHLGKRSGGRGEAAGGSAKGTKHKSRGRVLATARGWAQSQFNCTSAGVAKLDSHKKYLSARLFGGGWSAEEDELLQKRQLFKMLFLAKFQPGGSFMSEPLSRS